MRVHELDDAAPPHADDATLARVRARGRGLRRRRYAIRSALVSALVVTATLTIALSSHSARREQISTETPTSVTTVAGFASWPIYRDAAHDFSMPIPPGWYRTHQPLEPWLVGPGEILSLATTQLSPTGHHVACASGIPQTVVDNIGPHGIYLWLGEWHPSAAPYGTTPNSRPAHFADATWTALVPTPERDHCEGIHLHRRGARLHRAPRLRPQRLPTTNRADLPDARPIAFRKLTSKGIRTTRRAESPAARAVDHEIGSSRRAKSVLSSPRRTRHDAHRTAAVSRGHRITAFDRVGSDWEVCCGTVVGVGEVADRGAGGAGVASSADW